MTGINSDVDDNRLLGEIHALLNGSTAQCGSKPCSVSRMLASLSNETATVVRRLLDSERSTRSIHLALQRAGVRIGRDTLDDHRKKLCTCGEDT